MLILNIYLSMRQFFSRSVFLFMLRKRLPIYSLNINMNLEYIFFSYILLLLLVESTLAVRHTGSQENDTYLSQKGPRKKEMRSSNIPYLMPSEETPAYTLKRTDCFSSKLSK